MPVATVSPPVVNGNHDSDSEKKDFGNLVGDNYQFNFIKRIDADIKMESSPETSPKKINPEQLDVFEALETHADKQLKLNDGKPKKILRMSMEDLNEKRHEKTNSAKNSRGSSMKMIFLLVTVLGITCGVFWQDFRRQLFRHSRKEYNKLIHGQAYCTDDIDFAAMGNALREGVVGQNEALGKLEEALKSHRQFTAIVLHGPTGTGKTLTTQLLVDNFRWQENVQVMIYNPNDATFDLASITRDLSQCGHNLIIIDDLHLINKDLLTLRQSIEEAALAKQQKVILVFVFNVSKFETERNDGPIFEHLPKDAFRIIEYRRMTDLDLDKCMEKIEKELAVTLSHEQRDTVRQSVDVTKSGCKNVRSKVSLYS
ncbi:uncharacterized protein LOC134829312 [Culicoides brevitarsis]|uniref:uncharacterized protein LOC134829312 n=1 Tax=Culicoides brevitarsis TaxID=469753 RepID=UPI00307C868E